MYTVYKYTSPSNKVYIGLTSGTQNKRARSKGYGYKRCTAFWRAIEKYGWDNFTYEILAQDLTEEDAKQLEKYYIKLYDSTNPEKDITLLRAVMDFVFTIMKSFDNYGMKVKGCWKL